MTRPRKKRLMATLDSLKPSRADDVALCQAVEVRFLELTRTYLRTKGTKLEIPQSFQMHMLRWRQMAVRHKRGDFRNKPSEVKSLRLIAQWTVDVKCELCGQPRKVIDWGD